MNKEKVLLIIVDFRKKNAWDIQEVGSELEELVKGCWGEVVDKMFCRVDKPSPAYIIGKGKLDEISQVCSALQVDTIVFSHDLTGSQQRNIEQVVNVKTIDRTQLILDIFARHARTQAGKMQVELAQLEYLRPRLVGQGIALSRLGGGIGTLGPGETKLEVDRRRIAQKISKLKQDLKHVAERRALRRKRRKEKGIPMISLVGYTNAGKSTLLNRLTESTQLTRDGLFTTLDSVSRQLILENHQKVVLTDTVGFMHDLPHHLIESFNATLEQINEADLLLHVLDVSHKNFQNLYNSVLDVLAELNIIEKPIITVVNKIDKLEEDTWAQRLKQDFKNPVAISAKTGQNIPDLVKEIERQLTTLIVNVDLIIPINRMDLINLAHEEGQVFSVKYYNNTIHLRAALPTKVAGLLKKFEIKDNNIATTQ